MDMEGVFQAQAETLVKKATNGTSGAPDWSTILQILGVIESQASTIPIYIHIINRYLARGKKNVKMNALILIDALFKNSKRQQLQFLQCHELMTGLNEQSVAGNPDLHNFLYKSVPSWVANCASQNCLDPKFSEWQESICSMHFVPKLTPSLKTKLLSDVEAALEVLVMFAQCIIANFADGENPDDPLLREIMPNIREIARRTAELEPTVVDEHLHAALTAEREFCDYCQQVMSEYKKFGRIDANAIIIQMTKAQRVVKKQMARDQGIAEEPKKRTPPRRHRKGEDEMSVEEFFAQFDKIKGVVTKPVSNAGDDLIGLADVPQKAATDDLIDALIEI